MAAVAPARGLSPRPGAVSPSAQDRWKRLLEEGRYWSAGEIAEAEGIGHSFGGRLLRLTLLATDIQETILEGRQAKGMQLAEPTRTMPGKRGEQRIRGGSSNRALGDFSDHLRQGCKRSTPSGLTLLLVQSMQLPETRTAKGDTVISYATMHDIYHLLEADRLDEPKQPIPAPVAERDESDERHASGHEPKAQVGSDLAA